MMSKTETLLFITAKVNAKAAQRKITLDNDSREWIVRTLLEDTACGFSDSRMHRHMNSMLTRVKTEIRG